MAGGNLNTFGPHFSDVIRTIVDSMMLDHYTCLPAKIVKYDLDTQYADVQVQLYQKFIDGTLKLPPVIPQVPVKHPRSMGGKAFVHMPIAVGDDVLLVFSQRSLDNWKTQGGPSDPADPRKNHITDAFALIGGSAIPDAFEPSSSDSIEIVNDQTQVIVKPGGKFQIKNQSNEFVDVLDQITQEVHDLSMTLSTDTVNTIFGLSPLNSFAIYQNITFVLQDLLTKLESFKV